MTFYRAAFSPVPPKVVQQLLQHRLLLHRQAGTGHGGSEVRVPLRSYGAVSQSGPLGFGTQGAAVVRGREAPGAEGESFEQVIGDLEAGPVEVAVVEEVGALVGETGQETAAGMVRVAAETDQGRGIRPR